MTISRPALICFSVLFAIALTLACGSPSSQSSMRIPASISVAPATADPANYPNSQVQLTATGFYMEPPSPVTPIAVIWATCPQLGTTAQVSVSAKGVAECQSGAKGTFPVTATVPPPNPSGMCDAIMACGTVGSDCAGVHGVAHISCP